MHLGEKEVGDFSHNLSPPVACSMSWLETRTEKGGGSNDDLFPNADGRGVTQGGGVTKKALSHKNRRRNFDYFLRLEYFSFSPSRGIRRRGRGSN